MDLQANKLSVHTHPVPSSTKMPSADSPVSSVHTLVPSRSIVPPKRAPPATETGYRSELSTASKYESISPSSTGGSIYEFSEGENEELEEVPGHLDISDTLPFTNNVQSSHTVHISTISKHPSSKVQPGMSSGKEEHDGLEKDSSQRNTGMGETPSAFQHAYDLSSSSQSRGDQRLHGKSLDYERNGRGDVENSRYPTNTPSNKSGHPKSIQSPQMNSAKNQSMKGGPTVQSINVTVTVNSTMSSSHRDSTTSQNKESKRTQSLSSMPNSVPSSPMSAPQKPMKGKYTMSSAATNNFHSPKLSRVSRENDLGRQKGKNASIPHSVSPQPVSHGQSLEPTGQSANNNSTHNNNARPHRFKSYSPTLKSMPPSDMNPSTQGNGSRDLSMSFYSNSLYPPNPNSVLYPSNAFIGLFFLVSDDPIDSSILFESVNYPQLALFFCSSQHNQKMLQTLRPTILPFFLPMFNNVSLDENPPYAANKQVKEAIQGLRNRPLAYIDANEQEYITDFVPSYETPEEFELYRQCEYELYYKEDVPVSTNYLSNGKEEEQELLEEEHPDEIDFFRSCIPNVTKILSENSSEATEYNVHLMYQKLVLSGIKTRFGVFTAAH